MDTQLKLTETNFFAKPIMWSGIVAESGSLKSPTQKLIINPLYQIQKESDDIYDIEYQNYSDELESYKDFKKDKNSQPSPQPIAPKRREYFTFDCTSEAAAMIQCDQPFRGFLTFQDELKALISSQNAYRGGKGSDKEKLMSARDGSGIKSNRASGKRLYSERSGFSITGGIQPDVLKQLMGDFDDPDGFWARFIWCVLPVAPSRYPKNAVSYDIDNLLMSVYKKLESETPQTHKLSPEANDLYEVWFNQLDDLKLKEVRQGLRAVYSKMKGNTGEFALLLHRLNAAAAGIAADEYISEDTMAKAIKLSKFYITQIKLIHADGEASHGEIAPQLKKLYEFALSQNNWLSASDIKKGCRLFKKSNTEDIRQCFLDLVEMGYGIVDGSGKSLKYSGDIQNRQKLTDAYIVSNTNILSKYTDIYGLQDLNKNINTTEVDKVDKKLTLHQSLEPTDIYGLQTLDNSKVDKLTDKTNQENKNPIILDENITDLLEEVSTCQLMPSNPYTIAVDGVSTSVNFCQLSPKTSTSDDLLDEIEYKDIPTEHKGINKHQPEIEYKSIPIQGQGINGHHKDMVSFDTLIEGDVIFDTGCKPYTLVRLVDNSWQCSNGCQVSQSNIHTFHHAPKSGWE